MITIKLKHGNMLSLSHMYKAVHMHGSVLYISVTI